jgi:hypothetical protein
MMFSSPASASSRSEAGFRSTSFISDSRRCSSGDVPWMYVASLPIGA